ncbi:hypothetical protein B0E37_01521 [Streptomyces sp. MH192]|nr:hypothetical protein [Streptomyces sp. MH192]MCF0098085.1 hypothetical protein [Streptomyces sp. MH191]
MPLLGMPRTGLSQLLAELPPAARLITPVGSTAIEIGPSRKRPPRFVPARGPCGRCGTELPGGAGTFVPPSAAAQSSECCLLPFPRPCLSRLSSWSSPRSRVSGTVTVEVAEDAVGVGVRAPHRTAPTRLAGRVVEPGRNPTAARRRRPARHPVSKQARASHQSAATPPRPGPRPDRQTEARPPSQRPGGPPGTGEPRKACRSSLRAFFGCRPLRPLHDGDLVLHRDVQAARRHHPAVAPTPPASRVKGLTGPPPRVSAGPQGGSATMPGAVAVTLAASTASPHTAWASRL